MYELKKSPFIGYYLHFCGFVQSRINRIDQVIYESEQESQTKKLAFFSLQIFQFVYIREIVDFT